jgi:hypothetical protein
MCVSTSAGVEVVISARMLVEFVVVRMVRLTRGERCLLFSWRSFLIMGISLA